MDKVKKHKCYHLGNNSNEMVMSAVIIHEVSVESNYYHSSIRHIVIVIPYLHFQMT